MGEPRVRPYIWMHCLASAQPNQYENCMASKDTIAIDRAQLSALLAEVRVLASRLQHLEAELVALGVEEQLPAEQVAIIATPVEAVPTPSAPLAWSIGRAPIVLRDSVATAQPALPTNGIDIRTGNYLLEIDAANAARMAQEQWDSPTLRRLHDSKRRATTESTLGLVSGYSEDSLEDSGWAVVVSADDDVALLDALRPLIEHRAKEQGITLNPEHLRFNKGETCGAWYYRLTKEQEHRKGWLALPPVLVYRRDFGRDTSANTWLAHYGVSQGPVDPARGVPFYLLIAARPGALRGGDEAFVPFSFQYELDIFWGVGRLCFTTLTGDHDYAAYRAYAERLVAFERRADAAERLRKEIAYFGTNHGPDDATDATATELIAPLYHWHAANARTGAGRFGFERRLLLGEGLAYAYEGNNIQPSGRAQRADLERLLRGGEDGRPPAMLLSATHGLGLLAAAEDEFLRYQGALLCQDWAGAGHAPSRDHYFAGEDLGGDANVEGMVSVLFGCYSAGCPREDEYLVEGNTRPQIAPFPFISRLPQRLLLSGSFAVLGHIERAWTYAFRGAGDGTAQSQSFEDVLSRIAQGKRLGFATDQFNAVQGARSSLLANTLEDIRFGLRVDPYELAQLWIARNDARNYALLGDPAVRLPFNT